MNNDGNNNTPSDTERAERQRNFEDLKSTAQRFVSLLSDEGGRGMATWWQAVNAVGIELQVRLEKFLDLPTATQAAVFAEREHMNKAIEFMCGNFEKTFERLGAWKDRGYEGDP